MPHRATMAQDVDRSAGSALEAPPPVERNGADRQDGSKGERTRVKRYTLCRHLGSRRPPADILALSSKLALLGTEPWVTIVGGPQAKYIERVTTTTVY